MNQKLPILTLLFLSVFSFLQGQDLHYSQFYNAPLTINPALTGIFNGDQRISGSIRDQWRSVPVPWFTVTLGYDQKFYPKKKKGSFFGAGIHFNYDRQGDSNLSLSNLNLSGSYNLVVNRNNVITLGLLAGYSFRGFDTQNLTWDKQWNGTQFVQGADSGENFNFTRINFFESAAGLNYRFQMSSRTKVDLGIGAWHLLEPNVAFYSTDDISLPRRFSAYAIGGFKLVDKLDLQLDVLYQFQGPYDELLFGGYLQYYLNTKRGRQTTLRVGAGYRTSQAFYPKVALKFNEIFVAFSYDIDLSNFDQHTSGRGGPEIHVQYIITHVKPLGLFKVCPIF